MFYKLSKISSWSREREKLLAHSCMERRWSNSTMRNISPSFSDERKRRSVYMCIYICVCVYTRMKYSSWQALTHIESHGWVEQFEPPMFSDDGDTFLTILPKRQHDGSYWRHAVAITNVSSSTPRKTALTSGRFVVTEIVSWDQKKSYL